MRLMVYILCLGLIALGLRLMQSQALYMSKFSATINFGEFHAHIGILLIAVGVALFIAQMKQKHIE